MGDNDTHSRKLEPPKQVLHSIDRLVAYGIIRKWARAFLLVSALGQALAAAVPGLITLLRYENPTLRGDAANVLGIIGGRTAREALLDMQRDSNAAVRETAADALAELDRGDGPAGARAAGQAEDTRR